MENGPTSNEAADNTTTDKPFSGDSRSLRVIELIQLLIGASALIAGITYVIVRIALNHFYSAFGLTPEEVGWNATAGLIRFGVPIFALIFVSLYFVVIF